MCTTTAFRISTSQKKIFPNNFQRHSSNISHKLNQRRRLTGRTPIMQSVAQIYDTNHTCDTNHKTDEFDNKVTLNILLHCRKSTF